MNKTKPIQYTKHNQNNTRTQQDHYPHPYHSLAFLPLALLTLPLYLPYPAFTLPASSALPCPPYLSFLCFFPYFYPASFFTLTLYFLSLFFIYLHPTFYLHVPYRPIPCQLHPHPVTRPTLTFPSPPH